ncbi:hypothetical protein A2635_05015 [Candidatus Peribacteria bacterium RIFCSPHIGHO2_01_FULL_51_9]|nr:MAG: hypothetical protein A2635_05015 [Candidatus Peribacteria bacterium RIFCSPHIGHO2_01_FULL_51_9]
MSKRPTPKKRKAKSAGRHQHAMYMYGEIRRLKNHSCSPYAAPAEPKNKEKKKLKGITHVQA